LLNYYGNIKKRRKSVLDHKGFLIGLEDLKNLRKRKSELEADVKDVNDEIGKLVFDLVDYMEATDHESVKIAGLGTCSLTRTKKYSIDNAEIFEAWMKEHGEIENVLAVHAQKVHGYYKEKLENNEDLPPGIKTFVKNNITIRGN
jgi:hypothetical protein